MILEYFQFIDEVTELDVDIQTISCTTKVPESSTIFEGHFPGHPLLPGTLLIETMAQCCGFLILRLLDFDRLPFLIQVEKAKLRTFVEPGTDLTVNGKMVHEGSGFAVAEGKVLRDAKPIADAEMRFRTARFRPLRFRQPCVTGPARGA